MTDLHAGSSEYSAADQLMAMLAESFDHAGLPYVVIGGQAVIQHGYGRSTVDVDFTIAVGFDRFQTVVDHLSELGIGPRYEQSQETIRLNQIFFGYHAQLEVRADFSFVDAPYLVLAISRAAVHPIEGYPVRFLSLEDLFIHKVLASRKQDLADVDQLLRINAEVDHDEVERWLREYEPLVEKPLVDQYRALRRQAEM